MALTVYLSGEIHTDWRQQIEQGSASHNLEVTFTAPVTDHPASDAAGDMLGAEDNNFWLATTLICCLLRKNISFDSVTQLISTNTACLFLA